MEGSKSVIFVTGVCPERCWYCPLSSSRKGKDVIYVNEIRARDIKDIITEVAANLSKGAGITGGDPIARLGRTIEIIKSLKSAFGKDFHIHLYTSGYLLTKEKMRELVKAGLDEIRIHITGEHSYKALEIAVKSGIVAGVENPVIPGSERDLLDMIRKAARIGAVFVNLNELEFSEGNEASLLLRGYRTNDGISVIGSKETALRVMSAVMSEGIEIGVHFCPAKYKDAVQYRKRLARRAVATRLPYEEVDGPLVRWAEINVDEESLRKLVLSDLAVVRDKKVTTSVTLAKHLGRPYTSIIAFPLNPRQVIETQKEQS
jgi:pyruvate formate-lyase activating enzyme-like uncharacterized protein